jgi:hypothetical protein
MDGVFFVAVSSAVFIKNLLRRKLSPCEEIVCAPEI